MNIFFKKISLIIFSLAAACFVTATFANTNLLLPNSSRILKALNQGAHIQMVANYNKCTPQPNDSILEGGLEFNHFLLTYQMDKDNKNRKVIGMSNTILIHHSKLGFVSEYVRLHIFEDNSVEIYQQLLKLSDNSQLDKPEIYHCQLGAGVTLFSR